MKRTSIYRISFYNQGNIYELHARSVAQSNLHGFIEIADILFGERSPIVVDPSEERLKAEFADVKTVYLPLQAMIRIDEVERAGANRIIESGGQGDTVTRFPGTTPRHRGDT